MNTKIFKIVSSNQNNFHQMINSTIKWIIPMLIIIAVKIRRITILIKILKNNLFKDYTKMININSDKLRKGYRIRKELELKWSNARFFPPPITEE
mgnify:CR=1 FL=1